MSKRIRIIAISLLLVLSLALSFGAGCTFGISSVPDLKLDMDVVGEAWGIIFQDYVDKEKLDADVLSQGATRGAIKGMVEALDDPYTSYLEPQLYEMATTSLEGKYEGIGAYVGVKDEKITITAPIVGSPAERAGIKAGDIILEVDGMSTLEMSLNEAVLHIRGPKGMPVRLLVLHEGESVPVEIEIIRDEIKTSSVYSEMRGDIAYVRILHFSERTDEELTPVLENIIGEGATGIILDLRDCPGGLLGEVVDVTSHFLKEGVVVRVKYPQAREISLSVEPQSVTTELPMVILVNENSASGSEVLAGALQDHARATVAGTTTYGKGSVNQLHKLQDGSGLYITTARWLTPNGREIEGKGISPDHELELELEGEEAIQWAIDYLKGIE